MNPLRLLARPFNWLNRIVSLPFDWLDGNAKRRFWALLALLIPAAALTYTTACAGEWPYTALFGAATAFLWLNAAFCRYHYHDPRPYAEVCKEAFG